MEFDQQDFEQMRNALQKLQHMSKQYMRSQNTLQLLRARIDELEWLIESLKKKLEEKQCTSTT